MVWDGVGTNEHEHIRVGKVGKQLQRTIRPQSQGVKTHGAGWWCVGEGGGVGIMGVGRHRQGEKVMAGMKSRRQKTTEKSQKKKNNPITSQRDEINTQPAGRETHNW